ncbi:tetratricopeptide repeat protein, partial [Planctomycetota bacterium]
MVLAAAFVISGSTFEAGMLKGKAGSRKVTLEELIKAPNLYLEVPVQFAVRYRSAETDYQVFRTPFTTVDFAVFSAWPEDARLWEADERQKALPYLFVAKKGSVLPVFEELAKYQTVKIYGKIRAIYNGLPCIEVTSASKGSAPTIDDAKVKAFQIVVESVEDNPKYAIDEFEKMLAGPLPDVFAAGAKKYTGRSHFLRGEHEKAVVAYTEAIAGISGDPQLLLWKGIAECKAKQIDAALATITQCIALDPGNGYAKSVLGVVLGKQKKYEEAAAQCKAGATLSPRNPAVYWNYAEVLIGADRHLEASYVLEKALSLRRGDVEILKKLGDEYLVLKDVKKSLERFEEAVKKGPYDAEAHFGFARAYVTAGDSDKAKAEYLRAVELDPTNVEYHVTLGKHHMSRDEFLAAANRFKEVLKLDPKNIEAHFRLGLIAQRDGKWEDAQKCFREVVNIDPKHEMGYRHLVGASKALGDLESMIWAMEKICELVPKDHETRYALSLLYTDGEDYEKAIAHLRVCTEQQKKNASYHLSLAVALHSDDQLKEAEASYKTTLRLNPNSAKACNNLAYMFLSSGKKDSETFNLAKRAHKLAPDNSAFLDTMGWAYFVRGKLAEAKEYIGSSYKAKPAPEVAYHLGCVMMELGFLNDGERLLNESLNDDKPVWKNDVQK